MRKIPTPCDYPISNDDYKMDYVMERTIRNIESTTKWLYLGADATNPNFAKIGLTMGDLRSRSYSSANPDFYLFCAFKCQDLLTENDLNDIENEILTKFQIRYPYEDGTTKRLRHRESQRFSECFKNIDFLDFFKDLHLEIYTHHRNRFVISGIGEDDMGEGEFVDCEFNSKIVSNQYKYIKMIIQYP